MKIAVMTVVYKEVEPYIVEFLTSLQKQTRKEFVVVIVNDGLDCLENYLRYFNTTTIELKFKGSMVSIRKQAIRWLADEGFDQVVFADSDDYFNSERVEKTIDLLKEYDMVCNELFLFGASISGFVPMFSSRLTDGQIITANCLFDGNILGMSNTGVVLKKIIPFLQEIPDDIVAFDWLLFSKALLAGTLCCFTNQIQTYYRQHVNNIASPQNFKDEQIVRGVMVKAQQYANLQCHGKQYKSKAMAYARLTVRLEDRVFRSLYCNAIRENISVNPLWWEIIKTEKELDL